MTQPPPAAGDRGCDPRKAASPRKLFCRFACARRLSNIWFADQNTIPWGRLSQVDSPISH